MQNQSRNHHLSRREVISGIGMGLLGIAGGGWLTNSANAVQRNAPLPLLPDVIQVAPRTITSRSGIRVHAVQSGFVAVKSAHRDYGGVEALRLPAIATDPRWTSWMPIMTWVIEHPTGIIVVDTGETSKISEPDYTNCDPITHFIYQNNLRFAVSKSDELDAQMQMLNLASDTVKTVVQTHLHSDHVGRMSAFPNATFYVPQADYPVSNGTLPCHYPANFAPQFAAFRELPLPGFGQGFALTDDGDVWIVSTPGHTPGHQSVLLMDNDLSFLFAGDVAFDEQQLLSGRYGGIVADVGLTQATLANIREYAAERPMVFLPTHDPHSATRFEDKVPTTV